VSLTPSVTFAPAPPTETATTSGEYGRERRDDQPEQECDRDHQLQSTLLCLTCVHTTFLPGARPYSESFDVALCADQTPSRRRSGNDAAAE
jgi:hypothetical protein